MQDDWVKWIFMIEFADNNSVLVFINMSLFYINKDFHFRISFNFDIINYVIIWKRFDVAKVENIIDYI